MISRVCLSKKVLCAAVLTKTGHAGRYNFGNMLVIVQVSVQNHPQYKARGNPCTMHLPAAKHHKSSFAWVQ